MQLMKSYYIFFIFLIHLYVKGDPLPIVLNTWAFVNATREAWNTIQQNPNNGALDALVNGCSNCEVEQCDTTVGYGGSPDENGETTLEAMIFDGATMDMGSVGQLRRIKSAIKVARHVLENTEHSILVGDLATNFAKNFGFKEESLTTNLSKEMWNEWKKDKCQPNFWKNVNPNPKANCGPYESSFNNEIYETCFNSLNHDTIGMIVIDSSGHIVAGTSSNGAKFKIPGRVGDAPIAGAGAYAENEVGAAVATGDGDIMMRFLPTFLAVEEMRRGLTPTKAAQEAVSRIGKTFPNYFGAILAVNYKGEYGAACNGMEVFPFSVVNNDLGDVTLVNVTCKSTI